MATKGKGALAKAIALRKAGNAATAKGMKNVGAAVAKAAKARRTPGGGGRNAGFTFKGSGRSAAYRGAAGKILRAGGGGAANMIAANRAGNIAEQAYTG